MSEHIIPLWVKILTCLLALLGIGVSCTLLIAPGTAITSVDLNAKGVDYLLQMWAARQLACAAIFIWALFKKSIPMLTLAFIFYLVMNVGDVLIGWIQGDAGLWIGATVMCLLSFVVLATLSRRG